jgi:hypothetical protein
MTIESGRRWVLMKANEYFVTESAMGETSWSTDLARAELYSLRSDADHDFRVMAKRFPKVDLRVVEV